MNRSQSGRVTTDTATDTANAASGYTWAYAYDSVGRLSTADLAAQSPRPQVNLQYGFDTSTATGGCSPVAGKNGNRAAVTGSIGGATQSPVTMCYDTADRVLHDSTGLAYSYDQHGNATKVTNTTNGDVTIFVYDSADRHVKTVTPNGAGGTVTVTYTRDSTGRIITRGAAGAADATENGIAGYGFTASGDSPDIYIGTNGGLGQRVIGLAGGATYAKDYGDPSRNTWSYPNIHGDNLVTSTGSTGLADGTLVCYDPYGTPITAAGVASADDMPDTSPGAYDPGWLGQHLRYTEHTASLNYIQMGQRLYDPSTGRFLQVDPIEGGSANDYDYANADPTNSLDLDGTRPVKLKKGQKLSCGKGRYSYTTFIGGQKYWDCASKSASSKKRSLSKMPGDVVRLAWSGYKYVAKKFMALTTWTLKTGINGVLGAAAGCQWGLKAGGRLPGGKFVTGKAMCVAGAVVFGIGGLFGAKVPK